MLWDVMGGVARRSWARNPHAMETSEALNEYGVQKGTTNEVQFKAVTTSALKLEVQLPEKYSAGIFEWEVE
jgi:urocanate hydratase